MIDALPHTVDAGLGRSNVDLTTVSDPHTPADLDLAILPGQARCRSERRSLDRLSQPSALRDPRRSKSLHRLIGIQHQSSSLASRACHITAALCCIWFIHKPESRDLHSGS
jgi:hypothetical protein